METRPPTRALPKLVMKEWPEREAAEAMGMSPEEYRRERAVAESYLAACPEARRAVADFTRVVEETGILDQKETQRRKRASDHD